MGDTTSILDLPTDPVGGGSIGGNISFTANERIGDSSVGGPPVSLDQTTINQIVNGLQQASSSGMTQLQSRDIPRTTESITHDPQIQANYIPPATNEDYIKDYTDTEDIVSGYNKQEERNNNLDNLYNEIQIPLMIGIIYFLFQLPVFRKYLFQYFPILFFKDGNINIYGYLFTSTLFALLYYLLSKMVVYLT
jgi:hypothetical protein